MFNQKAYVPPPIAQRLANQGMFGQYSKSKRKARYKDRLARFMQKRRIAQATQVAQALGKTDLLAKALPAIGATVSALGPITSLALLGQVFNNPIVLSLGIASRLKTETQQKLKKEFEDLREQIDRGDKKFQELPIEEQQRIISAMDKAGTLMAEEEELRDKFDYSKVPANIDITGPNAMKQLYNYYYNKSLAAAPPVVPPVAPLAAAAASRSKRRRMRDQPPPGLPPSAFVETREEDTGPSFEMAYPPHPLLPIPSKPLPPLLLAKKPRAVEFHGPIYDTAFRGDKDVTRALEEGPPSPPLTDSERPVEVPEESQQTIPYSGIRDLIPSRKEYKLPPQMYVPIPGANSPINGIRTPIGIFIPDNRAMSQPEYIRLMEERFGSAPQQALAAQPTQAEQASLENIVPVVRKLLSQWENREHLSDDEVSNLKDQTTDVLQKVTRNPDVVIGNINTADLPRLNEIANLMYRLQKAVYKDESGIYDAVSDDFEVARKAFINAYHTKREQQQAKLNKLNPVSRRHGKKRGRGMIESDDMY